MKKKKGDKLVHSILKPCDPEAAFFFIDGRSVDTLKDLAHAMDTLSDHSFKHYVNEHKNDFENWIRHVHGNKRLANKLALIESKKDAQIAILNHIVEEVTK